MGKTHLMHAIGNYISNSTSKNVLYVTAESFMNSFINSIKEENADALIHFKAALKALKEKDEQ